MHLVLKDLLRSEKAVQALSSTDEGKEIVKGASKNSNIVKAHAMLTSTKNSLFERAQ